MKNHLLVSIVTPVFNNKDYIEPSILSVAEQIYPKIEHIIIDGGSTDGTLEIVKKHQEKIAKIASEKDKGIYDAMNKGISLAKGEIIGILNSDDLYYNKGVVGKVIEKMTETNADICWGDLIYVYRDNPKKVIRYWQSSPYQKGLFKKGWIPPHPTVFVKKKIYEQYGKFDLNFPISGDYEWLLRVLTKKNIRTCYLPKILVKMRTGGDSGKSLINRIKGNIEIYRAWKKNNLKFSWLYFPRKIIFKRLPQFLKANTIKNGSEKTKF